jgi:hypothetical protein
MTFRKLIIILLVLTALSGLATPLKAEYYLDTLFPIGITGIPLKKVKIRTNNPSSSTLASTA